MMKRFLPVLILFLSSCVYAGDYGNFLFPERSRFFADLAGYSVELYDQEPVLVKTELINEKSYRLNQSMVAARGYSVLSNKVFRKDIYRDVAMKPNENGVLNSGSVPVKLFANKQYRILGVTEIDNKKYRLIDVNEPGYVLLVDDFGNFYAYMGALNGDVLSLLDGIYIPYPANLKMLDVVNSKALQTKPVQGFDVKYDGVKMDRIWFTYFEFANEEADHGAFKKISFPNKPGLIEINGVGFRVLNATNDKIDYMVINEKS